MIERRGTGQGSITGYANRQRGRARRMSLPWLSLNDVASRLQGDLVLIGNIFAKYPKGDDTRRSYCRGNGRARLFPYLVPVAHKLVQLPARPRVHIHAFPREATRHGSDVVEMFRETCWWCECRGMLISRRKTVVLHV